VDFDTWFAETLLIAASELAQDRYGIGSLVLPALPFGPTPEHRSFGTGYIDLPTLVHNAVLEAVLVSLAAQGFGRILIWRGCGGHDLHEVVASFNSRQDRARALLPELPYHDIWCRVADPTIAGGHADSFTTSIMLHLRPDMVRMDRLAVTPESQEPDWSDPQLDFGRYSTTGVVGDPTHASAEVGDRLWQACVETAAHEIEAVALKLHHDGNAQA
jgi:creatinine amidohydrolase